jgi:hypothetical protein
MADMSARNSSGKRLLSEAEIDDRVVAEADVDEAWGPGITVGSAVATSYSLPAELAARAAFLARLHHRTDVDEWLRQVVRERIELEETAFAEAKRDLSARTQARSSRVRSRALHSH